MKSFLKITLSLLFFVGLSFNSFAAVATPGSVADLEAKKESAFKQLSVEEIFTMPKADIEEKIGRKLKFKEKLGLRIIQKAAKKAIKKRTGTKANENLFGILSISLGGAGLLSAFLYGYGALALGIAGIALGVVGLKRDEPKRILSILGIVFGSLVLLLAILVIAIFVSVV